MLLKYFYDDALAHASYLVGCQRSGTAIVIDPGRSVDRYIEAAAAAELRIVGSAETHIHADFVSGSRELADRIGARLYLSDEGPADWKYQFTGRHATQLLKDGDAFSIGGVKLEVLHTPGHTPESISFLLTDEGGGATGPMGIFTGDFVFVGSIGRPDLLETAAGVVGSADSGARQLYRSMLRFRELPEYLQVWPAHGAGSACGKGLGAIPSSTVGYEKRMNPALQYDDEQGFVDYILADQPETPFYFAVMKRVNKQGPALLRELPRVAELPAETVHRVAAESPVIDTRAAADYARSHVAGTINVPTSLLAQWAGFFVDYDRPIRVLTDPRSLTAVLRSLRSIGIDSVDGYFDADAVQATGLSTEAYRSEAPEQLRSKIETGEVQLVDVRSAGEFHAGHIPQAQHRFLGQLLRDVNQLDRDQPVVVHCQAGGRSAIAASILQGAGLQVINMQGGYGAWVRAELPTMGNLQAAAV